MKGEKFYKIISMLRPGFEPESSARKAGMIDRTTLPERTSNEITIPPPYQPSHLILRDLAGNIGGQFCLSAHARIYVCLLLRKR
jgi:hypothetical protein